MRLPNGARATDAFVSGFVVLPLRDLVRQLVEFGIDKHHIRLGVELACDQAIELEFEDPAVRFVLEEPTP